MNKVKIKGHSMGVKVNPHHVESEGNLRQLLKGHHLTNPSFVNKVFKQKV